MTKRPGVPAFVRLVTAAALAGAASACGPRIDGSNGTDAEGGSGGSTTTDGSSTSGATGSSQSATDSPTSGPTDTAPEAPEVTTTGSRLDVGGGSTSVFETSADGSTTATESTNGTTGFDSAPELPPG